MKRLKAKVVMDLKAKKKCKQNKFKKQKKCDDDVSFAVVFSDVPVWTV